MYIHYQFFLQLGQVLCTALRAWLLGVEQIQFIIIIIIIIIVTKHNKIFVDIAYNSNPI